MDQFWIYVLALNYSWVPVLAAALFIGMLGCAEAGYRTGKKRAGEKGYQASTGVVTGAIVTVLALLLGFSFGTAETRFDRRRQMIIEEANAIGTAYLRVDMLPEREQPVIRDLFRRYLDARLKAYTSVPDAEKALREITLAADLSAEIWRRSERATRGRTAGELLVLPALNAMIDIAAARKAVLLQHLPLLIIALLVWLSLVCSLMIGYGMSSGGKRNVFAAVFFAAAVSVTVYVIMDLEIPRFGLIRLDPEDRILFDLQKDLQKK